jgi:hypothetical protein
MSADPFGTDPFGTGPLRDSVLASWASSPTRFREDANAEEDLRLGAYRDRLLVELAQNAADAAGSDGVLSLSVVDGELRAANTGRPLDEPGVQALASLRASAKRDGGTVGRFGVGFAAVLAVTDEPSVVSTTGAVVFSARRCREAITDLPAVAELAEQRSWQVPVLRLPWPIAARPPEGFDTEVRLPLRDGVDPEALLAEFRAQAGDLLLALPGLAVIDVAGSRWAREEVDTDIVSLRDPNGTTKWLLRRDSGDLDSSHDLGVEASTRWSVCWAVPLDPYGAPNPLAGEILHAPTPTDERLSLPARLIASLPVEPSRRRVLPGPAADTVLAAAGRLYPRLLAQVPDAHRSALVPAAGLPLSEVDDRLRTEVSASLRDSEWLPLAGGGYAAPKRACVLDAPSAELAELLSDVVPGLLAAGMALPKHAKALTALEVPRLRIADVVEAVTALDREPVWWRRLYSALAPLVDADPTALDELGALPVPLADGRTLPGPRATLLVDDDEVEQLSEVDIVGLRVVHREAAHPLLERLGARRAEAAELLDADPVRDAVRRSVEEAESGVDTTALAEFVLRLTARAGGRDWLGALALPDADGRARRADELMLPEAALAEVLAEDAPVGVLDADLARRWPAEVFTAVGVLQGFAVVEDNEPTGPDHDLADESAWWESVGEPDRVVAVRDLDLVADDSWPTALRLLSSDPVTMAALRVPEGYTSWWLARYAVLAGQSPRSWRLPGAQGLAGLFDPVPEWELSEELAAAIGVRAELAVHDADDAAEFVRRLGDPGRSVPHGVVLRAHAALAAAVVDGRVSPADVVAPVRARVLSGAVASAGECVVLDLPWLTGVLPAGRVVAALDRPDLSFVDDSGFWFATPLAELFDLPLASESVDASPSGDGEAVAWAEMGAVIATCELLGEPVPAGDVSLYEELIVDGTPVRWWVTGDQVHAEDTEQGLANALAWTLRRWADRHLIAALLDDTDPGTLLG